MYPNLPPRVKYIPDTLLPQSIADPQQFNSNVNNFALLFNQPVDGNYQPRDGRNQPRGERGSFWPTDGRSQAGRGDQGIPEGWYRTLDGQVRPRGEHSTARSEKGDLIPGYSA